MLCQGKALTWDNDTELGEHDKCPDSEEEQLCSVVFIEWHQWLPDHHALQVFRLFEHFSEFNLVLIFTTLWNQLGACLFGAIGRLA